ncbi:hypothetical protein HNR00_003123 [Methylorubrum rhodinum]|uniref:Uncharacterized protein n=1 Tax=Methylorubrum rhodinum TaxID=29428 RepID=A0A840ZNR7_9HYPH|nr:hypothetical protein [Methylorubrum rhodinum]
MRRKSLNSLKTCSFGRLERVVTVLVEAQLTRGAPPPPDLIDRLRRMERSVREDRGDPQTIQVIESGRRLLGDASELASSERDRSLELRAWPDDLLVPFSRRG